RRRTRRARPRIPGRFRFLLSPFHLITSTRPSHPGLGSLAASARWRAPALGSEREREQRRCRVVGGGLDRRPADHVVLIAGGGGVERAEVARAAGPHAADGAESDEVGRAARAVYRGPELDAAPPVQGASQVRDLAPHAMRERAARP